MNIPIFSFYVNEISFQDTCFKVRFDHIFETFNVIVFFLIKVLNFKLTVLRL